MANLLDNFTGTAGTLLTAHTSDSGHTWTLQSAASGSLALNGTGGVYSTAASSGVYNAAFASWASLSADFVVLFQIDQKTNINIMGVVAGLFGDGSGSGDSYYLARYNNAGTMDLFRNNSSAFTAIGSSTAYTYNAADVWEFRKVGAILTLLRNGTAFIGPITDAAPLTAPGAAGIWSSGPVSTSSTGNHIKALSAFTAATGISLAVPSISLYSGAAYTLTAALAPTGTGVDANEAVTFSDGSGGAFSPASVTLTAAAPSAATSYTPANAGTKTLTATGAGALSASATGSVTVVTLPVITTPLSRPLLAQFPAAYDALVGQITWQAFDAANAPLTGGTTTGVYALAGAAATYGVNAVLDASWSGYIVWGAPGCTNPPVQSFEARANTRPGGSL